jgi:hypothetical protein
MIPVAEALDLFSEMSQATGVNLAVGLNAYIEDQDPLKSRAL